MFHRMSVGNTDFLVIKEGGKKYGIEYGPTGVEVVYLDDGCVVYRYVDDETNETWRVGLIEDVNHYVEDNRKKHER